MNETEDAVGRAYFEASSALTNLLDVSGWDDVMVLLRRKAVDRKADILSMALEDHRKLLDNAARYQDMADSWSAPAAPEQRLIDERITAGGN